LHAGRDGARVACAHHQPRAPTVRRCPRCPGGADCAHQADRAGARTPPRRRHGGDARRVRHRAELPFSECRARGAARGGGGDQRPAPRGAARGRPVDRGPADRGRDPPGVRAGAGRRRVTGALDWLRRYGALLRAAWLQDLQYRASIVLWLLWGVTLVVWLIVAAAWPAVRLPFGAGRWALTAAAVLLAAAMRFFISFATGLLAFWTTRATAIMELHAGISLFLSGRLAPLALLPP